MVCCVFGPSWVKVGKLMRVSNKPTSIILETPDDRDSFPSGDSWAEFWHLCAPRFWWLLFFGLPASP